ncbi:MAG: hypothetical protein STSR0009_00010 [Methanoregula sp.]
MQNLWRNLGKVKFPSGLRGFDSIIIAFLRLGSGMGSPGTLASCGLGKKTGGIFEGGIGDAQEVGGDGRENAGWNGEHVE